MRILSLLAFTLMVSNCLAQFKNIESVSISYYGEMITHPGIKVSPDFNFKEWVKTRHTKNDSSKTINKSLQVSPTFGFFYHKRYQTGLFFIPEAKFKRQNHKGGFYELGLGLGYLRTFIPNTYEVNGSGDVSKTIVGHNYFTSNYFVSFGKDLSLRKNIPFEYFIKPQFLYTVPNFPNGTGYFAIELGIRYSLK
ncbi:hypothetical protein [Saccharicrinis sp. FJH54]|uniref:hypothetical protein n=1 Tax=Saccharicrinis sp. FJH54 TaxID=3344665 RepID=UPI0035D49B46